MSELSGGMDHGVEDIADIRVILGILERARALESNFDARAIPIEDKYSLLQRYGVV